MPRRPFARSFALAALTSLTALSACSSPFASPIKPASRPTSIPVTATAAPLNPTAAPEANPLERVRMATIRIASKGNFVEPGSVSGQSYAGSGSGFIIDPSGIAITNAHVVIGAALIEVYVGDETRPRNARVVAVSECSDLAVLQIEGEQFPALEWHEGDIRAGMKVLSAGFPGGDPQFTFTSGVLSKDRTSGESDWASVEWVLEHDAVIRPGSSGGPLVSEDGAVVGVNYAAAEGGPFFAIGRDEALAIIDTLRSGVNVTSVGLNGQALTDGEFSGIWVYSVEPGSPADKTGVRPGDFITRLQKLEMGVDGTLADYCQILRSRGVDSVIDVEVIRPGSGERLEGQFNGRELEVVERFSQSPTAEPTPETAGAVTIYEAGAVDVPRLREIADAARAQYSQLIFETFDRGWPTRRSWQEDTESILRDRFYRLLVSEANTIRSVYWRPDGAERPLGADYLIEVDGAFDTGGAVGGVGLTFEGQGEVDSLSFIVRNDNTWQVIAFRGDELDEQYTTGPVPTDAIVDGVNQLRVWRTPDGALLWINNTPVAEIAPIPSSGGSVGVAAFGGEDVAAPVTLIVDNFRVLER
jgi:S1-C subfamily serine protease